MFNVCDRVKHVGDVYDFSHLNVESVTGTITSINDVPNRIGVMYEVLFDGYTHELMCLPEDIERIT